MLQTLRDRMTGPLVWFIVGLIVVPFAFFGIDQFVSGGGDPTVAKVGDQKITQSQWRRGFDQQLQRMQALLGDEFRVDRFNNDQFRQAVLRDMIEEARLRQFVREAGYRAPDAMLFEQIAQAPVFLEDGRFSTARYRTWLANRGYTPERFEAQIRESIVVEQLREGLLASAFVTEPVLRRSYELARQERALAYTRFKSDRYLSTVKVSEEEVQARYEEQKSDYMAPERLRVAYVELKEDELPVVGAPTEEVLKVIYEAEKTSRFSEPEERLTRHILIPFGADKDAARQRAEGLAQKIRNGSDFAKLAEAESADPGSRQKGGSLGWVRRGQMLETFEEVLFAMRKGQLSAPVETEFGWHLIRVDDIREARTRPFENSQVQAELLRIYRERERQERFQELSERLEQLVFESPNSLKPVETELGLKVQVSDWLTRSGGKDLFGEPDVLDAAFSEEVLQNDENSRPIAVGQGHVLVLRKEQYEAPRQRKLEEVASPIREQLLQEAARARATADAEKALAAARAGQPLEQVARQFGAEFHAPGLVRRDSGNVDGRILEALFRLPHPEGDRPSLGRTVLGGGDVAVIAMTRVNTPSWPPKGAALEQERVVLRNALAGAEFAAYRSQIEDKIPSEIKAGALREADGSGLE